MKTKKFITFEGIDASGKSTIMNMLKKWLEKKRPDLKCIFTREPGGSSIAEQIRKIILNKKNVNLDNSTEAILYAASRRNHLINTIWPALNRGEYVFCDRYLDSSLAYQGYGRGLEVDYVKKINMLAIDETLPYLTFFFDVSPSIAFNRLNSREEKDRLEMLGIEFQEKVYAGYKKLAKNYKDRYIIIDATKSINNVFKQLIQKLKLYL